MRKSMRGVGWRGLVSVVGIGVAMQAGAQTIIKYNNSLSTNSDTYCFNGQLTPGSPGKADAYQAYCPCVLKEDDGTYKMWYSAHDGTTARVYYATSTNGLDWLKYNNTRVTSTLDAGTTGPAGCLPTGSSGKGDSAHTHLPWVIKDDGIYRMWYGGSDGSIWRIYAATSSDGIAWTKVDNTIPTNSTNGRLALGAAGSGDTTHVHNPCVIKDGSTYKLWYGGYGGTPAAWRTYLATSPDGLTWTKVNNGVEASNDVTGTQGRVPLGATAGRGDLTGAYTPRVIKQGMNYVMWYQGVDAVATSRVYQATSPDGLTWTKRNNTIPTNSNTGTLNGRIALGLAGAGDELSAAGPSPVDEGRTIRLWYYGGKAAGTTTSRVFMATWTKEYPTIWNVGLTNLAATSVTLMGNLVATGQAPASVSVYWGTSDGGASAAAWANTNTFAGYPAEGAISTNLSGLASNTLYYYRWFATNQFGGWMTDPVGKFITGEVNVRATDASASEIGPDTGVFTLTRPAGATNGSLTVNYTVSGTASNGADYALLRGSATIPDGAASTTVTVTPIPNTRLDPARTVVLTLAAGGYNAGASTSATVTIARDDAESWMRQASFRFAGYTAAETLTNFPVLVTLSTNLTGFSYADFLSGVNSDLRFADAGLSNELCYEIEQWNTNGTSTVWVRLPTLASSNDTVWCLWGKQGLATPAYSTNGAVWDTNFVGVWHMTDTNPPNSVAGGVRGVKTNNVTLDAGQVGNALRFANTSTLDYVSVDGTGPQDPDVLTMSAWVKLDPASDGGVFYGHRSEGTRLIQLGANATNDARMQLRGSSNNLQNIVYTNDLRQWTHFVGVFDNVADRHILYVNGQPRATNTYDFGAETMTSTKQTIGTFNNGTYQDGIEGWIDEMRVSTAVRSPGWVWAEWMNSASNAAFVGSGSAQVGGEPAVVSLAATSIGDTSASLNGTLLSTGRADTVVMVYWGTTDGGNEPSAWQTNALVASGASPGPLTFPAADLVYGASYVYRYCASNSFGACWSAARTFATGGIAVRATDPVAMEAGLDGGAFTISRAPSATNVALTVYYSLSGTASNGVDYVALSNAVTLPAGASSVVVPVVPIQDAVADDGETVLLSLEPGSYSVGVLSNATVTILENSFSSWARNAWIMFSGYGRSETLTNFPVLVQLSTNVPGFRYTDCVAPDGSDLRFADATQTNVLNHEIERWDTNGTSSVWVQVPRLSGADTLIWAYWGRSNVGTAVYSTNSATWDSRFKGVWHMAQTNTADATFNRNAGVSYGNVTTTGRVGLAQSFSGSNWIQIAHSAGYNLGVPATVLSLSAWVKASAGGGGYVIAKARPLDGNANMDYLLQHSGTSVACWRWYNPTMSNNTTAGNAPSSLTDGQWHHLAYVNEGASLRRLYADGVLITSDTNTWTYDDSNTQPIELGKYSNYTWSTNYYTGAIDEVRIEGTARSSNWMWACWMNAMSNATFGVMGAPGAPVVSNLAVSGVAGTSATLNGYLALTGTAATAVRVYWGPRDGGMNASAWSNVTVFPGYQSVGPLATNVALPALGLTYYYRYCASNEGGVAWAPAAAFFLGDYVTVEATDPNASEQALDPGVFTLRRSAGATSEAVTVNYALSGAASNGVDYAAVSGTVTIPAGQSSATVTVTPLADNLIEGPEDVVCSVTPGTYAVGPSNTATVTIGDMGTALWSRRMPITFRGYTRSETLSNFPALITFSTNTPGFSYADVAFANGSDLMFMNSNATQQLDYEIERWDTNGTSYVWVRLPALASSNDTIWACWGNPFSTGVVPCRTNGAVWDTTYRAVWHLNETVTDEASSGVHYDATANHRNGTQSGNDEVGGMMANGQSLDGGDCISLGAVMTTNAYTKELWARMAVQGNLLSGSGTDHAFWVNGGYLRSGHNNTWTSVGDPTLFPSGTWQHVAVTYDPAVSGGRMLLYRNGVLVSSATSIGRFPSSPNNYLGAFSGNNFFNGAIDEARLSDMARSSNWLWACYLNQGSNAVFSSCGPVSTGPVVSNAMATAVSVTNATLNGYLSSTGASPTTAYVYWGPVDGGLYPALWAHTNQVSGNPGTGPLSVAVGPFAPDVTYYYRFYAVNGEGESWATTAGTLVASPVTIQATDATAATPGGDPGQFTVYRSASMTGLPLTVYFTAGGTAVGNTDYTLLSGSVTIPAGATNATIAVTPLPAPTVFQSPTPKTVTVTLSGGTCAVGTPGAATVTINQAGSLFGWGRRMRVTFSGYDRGETLRDFPVLVQLNTALPSFRYQDFLSAPNGDLRFTDGNRTRELNYEVDTWNTNGTSQVWVQVPQVSGSDSSFWVCWGKAGVSAPSYATNGSTWSNAYAGVWHLNETSGVLRSDATVYRTAGVTNGSIIKVNGMVGQADWYYYTNGLDLVTVSNSAALENVQESNYTVEAWAKPMSIPPGAGGTNDYYSLVVKEGFHGGLHYAYDSRFLMWHWVASGPTAYGAISAGMYPTNAFCHVAGVVDIPAGSIKLFVNGQLAGSSSFTPGSASYEYNQKNWRFGASVPTAVQFSHGADAVLDEPRISSTVRSSNWLWACWMNVASNTVLLDYGPVQPQGAVYVFR